MRISKEDLFSSEEKQRLSIQIPESEIYQPPTGLTVEMAYERAGGFGKFNILICIPIVLIYTCGQVIYLATPLMELEPEFSCLNPAT